MKSVWKLAKLKDEQITNQSAIETAMVTSDSKAESETKVMKPKDFQLEVKRVVEGAKHSITKTNKILDKNKV